MVNPIGEIIATLDSNGDTHIQINGGTADVLALFAMIGYGITKERMMVDAPPENSEI